MISRQLDTTQEPQSCDVCGRSLLRGEQANIYIAGGGRRTVCELCTSRAANEGWIREGAADAATATRPRGAERARTFVGRVRQRLEVPVRSASEGQRNAEDVVAQPEPRRVHAVPTNAELKVSRALELFNVSEHTRTVAGVARSLGAPSVSAFGTTGSLVEVVVGWELCWYRYEVDLAEEGDTVQLLAQGDELAELGELAPANATADERGELLLT
ncbi:MAG: hypothetical protein NVSMB51_05550 [Solirubrobacteraceae bacterium]